MVIFAKTAQYAKAPDINYLAFDISGYPRLVFTDRSLIQFGFRDVAKKVARRLYRIGRRLVGRDLVDECSLAIYPTKPRPDLAGIDGGALELGREVLADQRPISWRCRFDARDAVVVFKAQAVHRRDSNPGTLNHGDASGFREPSVDQWRVDGQFRVGIPQERGPCHIAEVGGISENVDIGRPLEFQTRLDLEGYGAFRSIDPGHITVLFPDVPSVAVFRVIQAFNRASEPCRTVIEKPPIVGML